MLSSSTGAQASYLRRDDKMSIFTYHLIEALTGRAQPQEGAQEVLVSDVVSHVHRCVPESARADYGARVTQTPDYRGTGNFSVALLLGGEGLSKGQPAPDPLVPLPGAKPLVSYHAEVHGSGVIAQRPGTTAAGGGGVAVGGKWAATSSAATATCDFRASAPAASWSASSWSSSTSRCGPRASAHICIHTLSFPKDIPNDFIQRQPVS